MQMNAKVSLTLCVRYYSIILYVATMIIMPSMKNVDFRLRHGNSSNFTQVVNPTFTQVVNPSYVKKRKVVVSQVSPGGLSQVEYGGLSQVCPGGTSQVSRASARRAATETPADNVHMPHHVHLSACTCRHLGGLTSSKINYW